MHLRRFSRLIAMDITVRATGHLYEKVAEVQAAIRAKMDTQVTLKRALVEGAAALKLYLIEQSSQSAMAAVVRDSHLAKRVAVTMTGRTEWSELATVTAYRASVVS